MPMALPALGENAALVTEPASAPSAVSGVPGVGASALAKSSPVRRRLTWPRERTRSTISWPV